jgi:hypothetical protein
MEFGNATAWADEGHDCREDSAGLRAEEDNGRSQKNKPTFSRFRGFPLEKRACANCYCCAWLADLADSGQGIRRHHLIVVLEEGWPMGSA